MKGTRLVYSGLALAWVLILAWQVIEHRRVQRTARFGIINRAKDISNTLGVVMSSQRRFGGVISQSRMETVLSALLKPSEVSAIALLNTAGEVVASAGAPIDFKTQGLATGVHWGERNVTIMNFVDLGSEVSPEASRSRPTIVLPRSETFPPGSTNRPPPEGEPWPDRPPPPEDNHGPNRDMDAPRGSAETDAPGRSRGWGGRRPGDGRPRFGRPPWISEEEYNSFLQKQGVHSFVIVLSTQTLAAMLRQDVWLRVMMSGLASIAVVGLALAWRNLTRSWELEVRLVRAAELNSLLKEMNLAAAGLAHETKNPLNIVRGLAQMISKQGEATPEIRQRSRAILEETDRVTAQLNEFINFSRPREVRRAAVSLQAVVGEVVRALGADVEEKAVQMKVQSDLPTIEADEQLLRQALFNLLINAIQAVPAQGAIEVAAVRESSSGVALEIRDNGPGVPAEHRQDIFKPYFTTTQKGTGLGLAVVQQIVQAHGWEIACFANEPSGAAFRIRHMRTV